MPITRPLFRSTYPCPLPRFFQELALLKEFEKTDEKLQATVEAKLHDRDNLAAKMKEIGDKVGALTTTLIPLSSLLNINELFWGFTSIHSSGFFVTSLSQNEKMKHP